MTNKEIIN